MNFKTFTAMILSLLLFSTVYAVAKTDTAGSQTNSEITLNKPEGVTFDSKDNLVVSDSGNNRILVFNPALKLIMKIENSPDTDLKKPGQLKNPAGIAVDSQGRFIIADRGNHRVQIFSTKGEFIHAIGREDCQPGTGDGEFRDPTHVTVDDRDNFIVTERWNHRLQVFDKTGKHLFTLQNRTGERPAEINEEMRAKANNPADFKTDWQKTDPGHFNEPGGVFYDKELKRLFVGNGWNCRIEVLDYDSSTGEIRRRPEEQSFIWGFWTIRSVTGDSKGRLIGTDSNFANLGVFNDRANLESNTPRALTVQGGTLGTMKDVWDVAVNSKDDVAVTDTANSRVIIFDSNFTLPDAPQVHELDSASAVISWNTQTSSETRIKILKAKYPMNTPGHENLWVTNPENVRELVPSKDKKNEHKVKLTKLEPATRYYYRLYMPGTRIIPGEGWSREYAFGTLGGPGQKAYLAIPVKIFLRSNIVDAQSVKPDTPAPEPMTSEDIALYRRDLDENQLFYWNNSSMQYLIDYDLFIDDTMFRTGQVPDDAPQWLKDLPDHGKPENVLIQEAGKSGILYYGKVLINANRGWSADRKEWFYHGSGGGTHGINWPTPGSSDFLGGSDIAWLMCHEYKHQVESQYGESGLNREDDRMIFCHFAPVHKGWEWSTAYDHGEHWDGIAYSLRVFTPAQYFRNLYGEIRTAKDTDGDGIPDDDPSLPMDEKRFGSDPTKADTDGDGLSDMGEILASKWVTCLLTDLRSKISAGYIRPDPRNKDSDGDGIEDGKDKYPIYPFEPVIKEIKAEVDGDLSEWPEKPQFRMDACGINLKAWTGHDGEWLYGAFSIEGDFANMNITFDLNADGFYVGKDNLCMWIDPDASQGPRMRDARLHICGDERWPYFDERDRETGRYKYVNPDELKWAPSVKDGVQIFEFAVPKRPEIGLDLKKGEEIGIIVTITPRGKAHISLFEPYVIFDMTVE